VAAIGGIVLQVARSKRRQIRWAHEGASTALPLIAQDVVVQDVGHAFAGRFDQQDLTVPTAYLYFAEAGIRATGSGNALISAVSGKIVPIPTCTSNGTSGGEFCSLTAWKIAALCCIEKSGSTGCRRSDETAGARCGSTAPT
jgi:hypothetical protein